MLTNQEHLQLPTVDVLDEHIERQIITVGEYLPDTTLLIFAGEKLPAKQFYSQKPLLLALIEFEAHTRSFGGGSSRSGSTKFC